MEASCTVDVNVSWFRLYGEQYRTSLKKLKIDLSFDPAIPLLGIHLEKTKVQKDKCTPNVHCNSVYNSQNMKALVHYTMEYYSALKKNAFESVLMRWMKLQPIIQSEVSQKEKHQYSILTHIYGI